MYDVKQIVENLEVKHNGAIPIFGSALWAYECAKNNDIVGFVKYLPHVAGEAKFRNWHEGIAGALRRFCRICLIDPNLVEMYLNIKFEEVEK